MQVVTQTNEDEKHSKPKPKPVQELGDPSARYATLDAAAQVSGSRLSSERSILESTSKRE